MKNFTSDLPLKVTEHVTLKTKKVILLFIAAILCSVCNKGLAQTIIYTNSFSSTNFPEQTTDGTLALTNDYINNPPPTGNEWVRSTVNTQYHTAPACMSYTYSSSAPDAWYITGQLNLTAGTTYVVTVFYAAYDDYPEQFRVTYGSAQTEAGQTNVLGVVSVSNINDVAGGGGYQEVMYAFSPATSGAYYVGFNASSQANEDIFMLDDITITQITTCGASYYTNPSASAYTYSIPSGVSSLLVSMGGGSGGDDSAKNKAYNANVGLGGAVVCTLSTAGITSMNVYIGGSGGSGGDGGSSGGPTGGSPGIGISPGGNGGVGTTAGGGGGGASSEIRLNGTGTANRALVAAGGGGTSDGSTGGVGGLSGATGGGDGGTGGTTSSGGSGGVGTTSTGNTSSSNIGADGGATGKFGGGGGGGGYFGGGGGGGGTATGNGGGGGGANYVGGGGFTIIGTPTNTVSAFGNGYVIITPIAPAAYAMTGGGSGCASPGVAVGLANSQSNVEYQLYNGATAVGSPVTGTGSAISFSNVSTSGTYTVAAYFAGYPGCLTGMSTSEAVSITNPTITLGTNPSVVSGTGTALLPISSTTGTPVNYTITWDATPVTGAIANGFLPVSSTAIPGSGSGPISLTIPTGPPPAAAVYNGTVTVTNLSGCASVAAPFTVTITSGGSSPVISSVTSPTVCAGAASAPLPFTATNSPTTYTITWDATAQGQGFALVTNATIPGSGSGPISLTIPTSPAPPIAGTYNGTLTVTNGTGTSPGQAFTVTIPPMPTITLGTFPSVSMGTTSASLPYTATTGSPTTCSITWDATPATGAIANGFSNVPSLAMPGSSPISLTIPSAPAAAVYNGTVTVTNACTLTSANVPFTVTITSAAPQITPTLPVAYWSMETNPTTGSLAVTDQVSAASASAVSATYLTPAYSTGAGLQTGTSPAHNGAGAVAGMGLLSGAMNGSGGGTIQSPGGGADPGTGATTYLQFNLSTTGLKTLMLLFDVTGSSAAANNPSYGVLYSTTAGGASGYVSLQGGTQQGNSWSTNSITLPAACENTPNLYIRIYNYASATTTASSTLTFDNIAIYAASTQAGAVFTTANENDVYKMMNSTSTAGQYARNSFMATGAGTNVTINASGLSMAATQTFSVSAGAVVTFGSTGAIAGAGGFILPSGCSMITANIGGINGSVTSTGTNTFNNGANYTFNGATTQVTGTSLPATFASPGSLTINNTSGVTLSNATIFGSSDTLNLRAGLLTITPGLNFSTVTGSPAYIQVDNGTLSAAPTFSVTATKAVNVSYQSLNYGGTPSTTSITTGYELPVLTATPLAETSALNNLTINKAGATITLGPSAAPLVSGTITVTAGLLALSTQTLTVSSTTPAVAGGPFTTGNMIVTNSTGIMKKLTPITAGSYLFPIGDQGPNYAPITLSWVGSTVTSGTPYVSAGTTNTKDPHNTNATDYLNRYWSVGKSGVATVTVAQYNSGDVVGNENNIIAAEWKTAIPWVLYSAVNTGTHTLSTTSLPAGGVSDVSGISKTTPSFTAQPGVITVCQYAQETYTTQSGMSGYTWTYPGSSPSDYTIVSGGTTSSNTVTLEWLTAGSKTVGITYTDGNGIAATGTTTSLATTILDVPTIADMSGNTPMCAGGAGITLTNSAGSGTWSSGNTTVASVNTTSGLVANGTEGTATITYTNMCGSAAVTTSVNATPVAIAGNTTICTGGLNTQLSDNGSPNGTWSSSIPAAASVSAAGLLISGATGNQGITVISYNDGCSPGQTQDIMVNDAPQPVTGSPTTLCFGGGTTTTTLVETSTGGTWSSHDPTIATVDNSGDVTSVSQGVTTITYSNVCGPAATQGITVNEVPQPITGSPTTLCFGGGTTTTTLGETSTGGTWSSNDPTIATVDNSGDVMSESQGVTTITYSNGCGSSATQGITVNEVPQPITGSPTTLCFGGGTTTTTLGETSTGGTWSSNDPTIATVDNSGDVTSESQGITTITYSNGCGSAATQGITVNEVPQPITGSPTTLCFGGGTTTMTLGETSTGGTWSSNDPTIATVDNSGDVMSESQGVTTITYSNGCGSAATQGITVNEVPQPITGSPTTLCFGGGTTTTTLGETSTGGTWSSNDPTIATVDNSGDVTSQSQGVTTITYSNGCGSAATQGITVNEVPQPITGSPTTLCFGGGTTTTTLGETSTGGTWSSNDPTIATVDNSGDVTSESQGITTITYSNGCGSAATQGITVNEVPQPITGSPTTLCFGGGTTTTTLGETSTGGTWSSNDPTIATVDNSGDVTSESQGVATITYDNGCGSTATQGITVNAVPAAITGNAQMCTTGSTITLANTSTNGTWSGGTAGIATVTGGISLTGTVTPGATQGTTTISYSNGCGTAASITATVNASPAPIGGNIQMCAGGSAITLTNTSTNGTWSGGTTGIATVSSSTGVVTPGATQGNTTISYSNGCGSATTTTVTVSTSPAPIIGNAPLCANGSTITLTNTSTGGTWSGSVAGVATVNTNTGVVRSGLTAGDVVISYNNGCSPAATVTVTVNPLPIVHTFTGGGAYCALDSGVHVGLTLSDTGISYQLYNGSAAVGSAVAGTGDDIDFGLYTSVGVYHAIATNTTTLCTSYLSGITISINPLPDTFTVTGGGSYCVTGTGVDVGLDGSATGINYQLYNGSSPVGSAMAGTGGALDFGLQTGGLYTVMASNAITLCPQAMAGTATVTVIPLPTADTVTGGGGYCASDSGVHVGLNTSDAGTIYQLYLGGSPIGTPNTSAGGALDFGLQTLGGVYTVFATNPVTTCSSMMTGSVTVTVNPLPVVYDVTGGGSYCAGGTGIAVGLSNSDHGIGYQLYTGATTVGSALNGIDAALSFGLITVADTYRVVATDTTTGCMSAMNDSAVVTITPVVIPHLAINTGEGAGDTVCAGSPVTFTAQTLNGGATPTYQWSVENLNVGTNDSTYTYIPAPGNVIAVTMISSAACAMPDTLHDTMRVQIQIPEAPSVFIIVTPETSIAGGQADTLIAVATNCGSSPKYQWYNNGALIAGATNVIYTSSGFTNHDSISVRVITSGACGGRVTDNSVIITVFSAGVTQVTQVVGDVRLMPNPNKGAFTVQGTLGSVNDEEVSIEITDMLGQVVYSNKIMTHNGVINEQIQLSNTLANGMYLLNMLSATDHKVFHFVVAQ